MSKYLFKVNNEDTRVTSKDSILVFVLLICSHALQERMNGLDPGKHAAQKPFALAEKDKVNVKRVMERIKSDVKKMKELSGI